jgi:hypothetical protein
MAEAPERYDIGSFFRRNDLPVEDWAGCTIFMFPELEVDDRPILIDPLVRRFYRHLSERVPYLIYFLEPDPHFGAVLGLVCAYARDDQIIDKGDQFEIIPDRELNEKIARGLSDAAMYAAGHKDDWRAMIDEYGFSVEIKAMATQLTEKRLVAQ